MKTKNYNIWTKNEYSALVALVGYAFNLSYQRSKTSPETAALLEAYRGLARKLPKDAEGKPQHNGYRAMRGNLL